MKPTLDQKIKCFTAYATELSDNFKPDKQCEHTETFQKAYLLLERLCWMLNELSLAEQEQLFKEQEGLKKFLNEILTLRLYLKKPYQESEDEEVDESIVEPQFDYSDRD